MHALDVADNLSLDCSTDDEINDVLIPLRHDRHRLDRAVHRRVLVPAANRLLRQVGKPQKTAVSHRRPHDRIRRLRQRHVNDLRVFEEVRGSDRQIACSETRRLPVVPELAHVPATGGSVNDRGVDHHRHDVRSAYLRLHFRSNRIRRHRGGAARVDSILRRIRHRKHLLERRQMQDARRLLRRDGETQAVVVLRGERVTHVGLGTGARHPHHLRSRRRSREASALFVVADRAGVVARLTYVGGERSATAHRRNNRQLRRRVALPAGPHGYLLDAPVLHNWHKLRAPTCRVLDVDTKGRLLNIESNRSTSAETLSPRANPCMVRPRNFNTRKRVTLTYVCDLDAGDGGRDHVVVGRAGVTVACNFLSPNTARGDQLHSCPSALAVLVVYAYGKRTLFATGVRHAAGAGNNLVAIRR